ncbi:nucleotidyltransferase family protein [Gracilimonas halophila]|uniref:NDP-sugar synthase n=1 Tax=Gracilimonas halophila TaxID=1834464 RepID=A0ABW5JES2_9BACT
MPSLVLLAAGMGSRYGGTKQFSTFGPYDHLIIDYTILDAIEAGFEKIVVVIRKEIEPAFNETVFNKWKDRIDLRVVYQELDSLPEQYQPLEGRTKPWGTAHAVWMAENEINEPFAIANADDFYGREAIQKTCDQLKKMSSDKNGAFIIGYELGNTLSPNGSVSRGLCHVDESGNLINIEELKSIEERLGKIISETDKKERELRSEDLISMNLMGFTPSVFDAIREGFDRFYKNLNPGSTAEFYLANVLTRLLNEGVNVSVIPTNSQWFGVTYSEDKEWVNRQLTELHESGVYPDGL